MVGIEDNDTDHEEFSLGVLAGFIHVSVKFRRHRVVRDSGDENATVPERAAPGKFIQECGRVEESNNIEMMSL